MTLTATALTPARVRGGVRAPRIERLGLCLVALTFALLTEHVYVDVFVGAGIFEYMGLTARAVPGSVRLFFLALAVLPSLWLPLHMRRPSDIVQLFLYYAVYLQTVTLVPLVSSSPRFDQLTFCVAFALALLALDVRSLLPRLRVGTPRLDARVFWAGVLVWYCTAFVAFQRSGNLTLRGPAFADVYDLRAELADRLPELGKVFIYTSLWSGSVFAPLLTIAGLHRRRFLLVVAGVALAWASFVVSTNRANYMAIIPVIGGYYLLYRTEGRHLAVLMGIAFIALTGVLLGLDRTVGLIAGEKSPPLLTFQVFFRTFANNGFLSAVYLDVFRERPFGWYADSFLRAFSGPRLAAPIPRIAGSAFTDVQGNWANANVWADAYANLGYLGVAISTAFTAMVMWVYDGIAAEKSRVFTAAMLIVPASILANTSTQTALTSNGLLMLFIVVAMWPYVERRGIDGAGVDA